MRITILVSVLFLLPMIFVGTSAEEDDAWRLKADEALLRAYDDGESPLTIGVRGPAVPEPLVAPSTRAEWNAYWADRAAPFLSKMRDGAADAGAFITNEFPAVNTVFMTVDRDALPALVADRMVQSAALDWEGAVSITTVDEDPGIFATLGQTVPKVQAPDMWALGYRGAGVKLAVIDTGIRSTHEMMRHADGSSRVTEWYDATTPISSRCATPCDTNGHGTHVGTTAAGSNFYNPDSPVGVAPEAEVFGVRIFRGAGGQWEWALEGLQAAFDLGADVSTNSWGGGCSGLGITTAELAETLQNAGMYNVFAAGNSGTGGVGCPGRVHNVVTVGGIDVNDNLYGSSSRGPCTWPAGSGDTRICPDVNAVAVNVEAGWWTSDTAYNTITGTSMATPHVAGVVVLLEEAKRDVKGAGLSAPDQEAEILLRYTAKDLGALGPDNDFGWGTAQALDAFNQMVTDQAVDLPSTLGVSRDEVRQSQSVTVSFAVANLGAVSVDGHLDVVVEQVSFGACPPTCHEVVLADEDVALDPVRELRSVGTLSGGDLPAGDYVATASFAYTYVDPVDGLTKSGLIEHTGTFTVLRVDLRLERAIPIAIGVGEPLLSGFVIRNVGNEDASNVRFVERFRADGLVPVPVVPPADASQEGIWADPAPSQVTTPSFNPPVREYRWNIGAIEGFGADWQASYNFAGGAPGEYVLDGKLTYQDGIGTFYTLDPDQVVTVGLPV